MLTNALSLLTGWTLLAGAPPPERDLLELSLEELSEVEVTSVSKVREPLGGAASAVTVISDEDLRRAGVTSIPEALRLAPGIHVGRVSASSWAVSSRGFSSVQSNKLLVLTDTRSIYTPLFSGVFWDMQDLLLDDIERIEVIRGPGGTLWGANAVNGVINITTKSARDTQGLYAQAGVGTEERGFASVRYGGKVGERFHYRAFAKFFNRDGGFDPAGPAQDKWWRGQVGFRADWEVSDADLLVFQGDLYRGALGQTKPSVTIIGRPGPEGPLVANILGGNVLAKWVRQLGTDSSVQLRAYYDRTRRDDPAFLDDLDTFDVDFQHRLPLPLRQDLLWGVNYRVTANRNQSKVLFRLDPPNSVDHLVSLFVQDRITLLDSLRLTVGTKFEHNDFSGFELQPSGRLAWTPTASQTVWAAVSRAVRVPTRLERDVAIDITEPTANPRAQLAGNRQFAAEQLLAYELGYRFQITSKLGVDVAAFWNDYRGIASLEMADPVVDPVDGSVFIPVVNRNLTDGVAKGVEAVVSYSPFHFWQLSARYSNLVLSLNPRGEDLNRGDLVEGASPRHQVGLTSWLDLPGNLQLNCLFRYVSKLDSSPDAIPGEEVPAYAELDAQVAWNGWKPLTVAVVGQNLLQGHHREFYGGTAVERSVYLKLTGRF